MPTSRTLRLPLLLLAVCAALVVSAVAVSPAHGHAPAAACNLCLTAGAPAIVADPAPAAEPLERVERIAAPDVIAQPASARRGVETPRGPPSIA